MRPRIVSTRDCSVAWIVATLTLVGGRSSFNAATRRFDSVMLDAGGVGGSPSWPVANHRTTSAAITDAVR